MFIDDTTKTTAPTPRTAAAIFGSDDPIHSSVQVTFLPQRLSPHPIASTDAPRTASQRLEYLLWACADVGRQLFEPFIIRGSDGERIHEVRCQAVVDHLGWRCMIFLQEEPAGRFWAEALGRAAGFHLGYDSVVVSGALIQAAGNHFQTLRMLADCADLHFSRTDAVKAQRSVMKAGGGATLADVAHALGGASALDRAMAGIGRGYLSIDPRVALGLRSIVGLGPRLTIAA